MRDVVWILLVKVLTALFGCVFVGRWFDDDVVVVLVS